MCQLAFLILHKNLKKGGSLQMENEWLFAFLTALGAVLKIIFDFVIKIKK